MSPHLLRFLFFFVLFTASARAHEPFEITTAGRVRADSIELRVTMARSTAQVILDDGKEDARAFTPEQFPGLQPRLLATGRQLYRISSHNTELAPLTVEVALGVENDVEYFLLYPRPQPGLLTLDAVYLQKLASSYGNALNLTQDNPPAVLSFTLLTAAEPGVTIPIAPPPAQEVKNTAPGETPPAPAPPPLFKKFLKLGLEHILIGYDHLLFLAGLLVVTRHARSMIGIITCFTLAHSITLALAALDVVVISGKIIEPLIAASIVFVGLENLLTRGEPKHRWALTFAFGLIHGFGFAGVLRELGLGSEGNLIAVPLFAFNLGVEIGQLLVAAIALPLLLKLHQRGALGDKVARAISVIVVLLGSWWLLERTVLS